MVLHTVVIVDTFPVIIAVVEPADCAFAPVKDIKQRAEIAIALVNNTVFFIDIFL